VNPLVFHDVSWKRAILKSNVANARLAVAEALVSANRYDDAVTEYKSALRLRQTLETTLTGFSYFYGLEPKGQRYWLHTSPFEWMERYDSGQRTVFLIVGRSIVEGDYGVIADKQDGSGLVGFIPDKGSHQMVLRFRVRGQQEWNILGEMTHIE
jgi:hypothetical protein